MNKKQKSSIILASLASIAVAGSVISGATYALFTSESKTNIAVTSGTVDVTATIDSLVTYSGSDLTGDIAEDEAKIKSYEELGISNGTFLNGGTANIDDNGDLVLEKVTPGDKVSFNIKVKNNSNVAIKYCTIVRCDDDNGLFSGLEFTINNSKYDGLANKTAWTTLTASGDVANVPVEVILPTDVGNAYQEKSCKVSYTVEAVQGNAKSTDPEDGVIEINNARELGFFRNKVNSSVVVNDEGGLIDKDNKQASYFAGKTVKLTDDIDLENVNWIPICWVSSIGFTFDGNNKTVSNFTASERIDDGLNKAVGFFAYATGATIKNLNIDNATINGVNHSAAVVGDALCSKIENCKVTNSTITSSYLNGDDGDKAGAIAGYLSAQPNAYVKDCTVKDCTIKGYRDVGGAVGYAGETAIVSGVSIIDTTIINDRSNNYKGYKTDTEFDVHEVVGEASSSATVNENTYTNVTIQVYYSDGFYYELSTEKFYVTSKAGMFNFASYVNSGNTMIGKTVELRASVDLEDEPWQPIMNFQGTFDGLGNNIKNLYIEWNKTTKYSNWGPQYIGLFGKCDFNSEADLIIKNFSITNAYIKGGDYGMYSGIVLGNGTANINDVTINGLVKVESNSWYVGGIAGGTYVKCNNCHIDASEGSYIKTTNSGNVGGIVGLTGEQNSAKYIKNCSVKNLTISGLYYVGGIAGTLQTNMNIEDCTVSECTINGEENVGVFFGRLITGGVCDETKNTKENVTVNGVLA